jgi:hypothetical protein
VTKSYVSNETTVYRASVLVTVASIFSVTGVELADLAGHAALSQTGVETAYWRSSSIRALLALLSAIMPIPASPVLVWYSTASGIG